MMMMQRAIRALRTLPGNASAAPLCILARGIASSSSPRSPALSEFLSKEDADKYHREGYLVLEGFCDSRTCDELVNRCNHYIRAFDPKKETIDIFSTVNQRTKRYFLESSDKVRYFFEEHAFNDKGELTVPVERALNKIGHALHTCDDVFRAFTFQPRVQSVVKALGYKQPLVPQSMYIFKQPGIGGVVTAHQDSTFLHTTPLTTMGIWTPLEDCTVDNGCLWVLPGSHRAGIHNNRRMVRVTTPTGEIDTTFTAGPAQYDKRDFIPVEVKRGSTVLIHGELVHLSEENKSPNSRHAYIFHLIEGAEGVVYDHLNWLQPPKGGQFPALYQSTQ